MHTYSYTRLAPSGLANQLAPVSYQLPTKAMIYTPSVLGLLAFQNPAHNCSVCGSSKHVGKLLNVPVNDMER